MEHLSRPMIFPEAEGTGAKLLYYLVTRFSGSVKVITSRGNNKSLCPTAAINGGEYFK